jgi:hypothetical protein
MTDWEKLERMAFVLGEIARGRCDNGRPLAAETSRQMARTVLDMAGLGWPYGRPASKTMRDIISVDMSGATERNDG